MLRRLFLLATIIGIGSFLLLEDSTKVEAFSCLSDCDSQYQSCQINSDDGYYACLDAWFTGSDYNHKGTIKIPTYGDCSGWHDEDDNACYLAHQTCIFDCVNGNPPGTPGGGGGGERSPGRRMCDDAAWQCQYGTPTYYVEACISNGYDLAECCDWEWQDCIAANP